MSDTLQASDDRGYTYRHNLGSGVCWVMRGGFTIDGFRFSIKDVYLPDMDSLMDYWDYAIELYWEG